MKFQNFSEFSLNMTQTKCHISAFAPISQIRFWGAQVICVATPSAFFVVYSIQRKNKVRINDEFLMHMILFFKFEKSLKGDNRNGKLH